MIKYFKTLVQYRELLYFMVLRDIKSKYKQSVLGVSWAILQPLSLMLVFTLVFSFFARLPSDGAPYALFSYCALLPWQFFASVLGRGVSSLVSNQALVQKVYFPREIIPLAIVFGAVVDFIIGCGLFLGLLWYYKVHWSFETLLIFPVFVIQVIFVLGIVLFLAPLNVFYRDIGFVIPLVLQIWMYATPIIYPLSLVPQWLRPYYALNPMTGIIEAYRRLLVHGTSPDYSTLIISAAVSSVILGGGLLYFKRMEFRLADVM